MIIALAGWNTIEGHLVLGSVLSLVSSLSVIFSYIMIMPWRKHPSSLILYRSLTSTFFSINILRNAVNSGHLSSCRDYAVITQIMLLSGECWLTTIALDLVQSLTNPFSSYKYNMKKYSVMVWSFTAVISFIFFFNEDCQGKFDRGICWVKISSTHSPCLWGYFLFWIILMYAYQMWAAAFAYMRLKKGLPLTFEVRKQCAIETYKCLSAYAAYLSIMMFFFAIISSSNPNPIPGSPLSNFSLFLLFVIANRGSVDGAVWFMLHDFNRDQTLNSATTDLKQAETVTEGGSGDNMKDLSLVTSSLHIDSESDDESHIKKPRRAPLISPRSRSASVIALNIGESGGKKLKKVRKDITKNFTDLADLAIAEFDENDLSPQVNMALRTQIVSYVTSGVKQSVRKVSNNTGGSGIHETHHHTKVNTEDLLTGRFAAKKRKDPAVVTGLEVLEFDLEGEHPFKAFAPSLFQELRMNEGNSDLLNNMIRLFFCNGMRSDLVDQ